jgi:two-component system response regulator FlrC
MKLIVVTKYIKQHQHLITLLKNLGYEIETSETIDGLFILLSAPPPSLVIMGFDHNFPDSLSMAAELLRHRPGLKVLLIASNPTIEDAISAMQMGIADILCQPFDEDALRYAVERNLTINPQVPIPPITHVQTGLGMVCRSPIVIDILNKAKMVAKSKASVLICGESGTGKELLARYIHENSDRKDGPFVALNCACLPETLLESELFGYEKGAFSGATARKLGKFELADKGTLLLDEIGEMALPIQAKLLRVLQEGEVDRLGGTKPVKIDVRILAATNRDLKKDIQSGRFREDLFYRLNVIQLKLPALRERREDIPVLADFFLQKFTEAYAKPGLKFANTTIEAMLQWPWPGNIRELKNAVERGVLLAQGGIILPNDIWDDWEQDVKGTVRFSASTVPPGDLTEPQADTQAKVPEPMEILDLGTLERLTIQKALQKTDGNRTHAAQLLGISVRTLRNKLLEYRRMGIML